MTTAGTFDALPMTRSPADASSSTTQTSVASRILPFASAVPRRSMMPATPAHPIATSATPLRHARPNVSEMTTAISMPRRRRRSARSRRAERSGSSGSSTAQPSSTFERSTPAFAHTKPCVVSVMSSSPRRRRIRVDSLSTRDSFAVASAASTLATRPSAFATILEVTTRTSPASSERSPCTATASQSSVARSSPVLTSPMPSIVRILKASRINDDLRERGGAALVGHHRVRHDASHAELLDRCLE